MKQRHESINAAKEETNNKKGEDESEEEKTDDKENHIETTHVAQSEPELESQMKSSHIKVRFLLSNRKIIFAVHKRKSEKRIVEGIPDKV